jgi:hypothetical protein
VNGIQAIIDRHKSISSITQSFSTYALLKMVFGVLLFMSISVCQSQWQWRNPTLTGNSIEDIVWTGKQFVAVESYGHILISPDGLSWSIHPANRDINLSSITWTGTILIAVGWDGVIITSKDGLSWSKKESGTANFLSSVEWIDNKAVVIGSNGTFLVSEDCENWISRPVPTIEGLNGVAWNGVQFMVVGYRGVAFTSIDGSLWTDVSTNWLDSYYSIVWNGSNFVAFGFGVDDNEQLISVIATFMGGNSWIKADVQNHSACTSAIKVKNQIFVTTWDGEILTSTDGEKWILQKRVTDKYLYSIVWNGDIFIATGQLGSIVYSKNGIDWEPINPPIAPTLYSIAWGNNQFVAAGSDSTVVTSSDGITWKKGNCNQTWGFKSITWTGSQFVGVGHGGIGTSPDGVTWTNRNVSRLNHYSCVKWTGKEIIALGNTEQGSKDSSIIDISKDAITWERVYVGPPEGLTSLAYNDSIMVVVASNTGKGFNGIIYNSSDGHSWSYNPYVAKNGGFRSITWTGTRFVAVGIWDSVHVSNDGIKWSSRPLGFTAVLQSVVWTGKECIAVGSQGVMVSSPDGLTWTKRTPYFTSNDLESAIVQGNTIIAVGYGGTIMSFNTSEAGIKEDFHRQNAVAFAPIKNAVQLIDGMLYLNRTGFIPDVPIQIKMFNIAGKEVLNENISEINANPHMDMRQIPSGTYIARVAQKGKNVLSRVTKF